MPLILLGMLTFLQLPSGGLAVSSGVRNPTYAPDGRLAFELRGDVWVLPAGSGRGAVQPVRVTSDPAWDGEPAWTRAGDAIVFVSDRSGNRDLWRVPLRPAGAVGSAGSAGAPERSAGSAGTSSAGAQERLAGATITAGAPERLTATARAEADPSVGPDGVIVFVRGRAAASDLWLLGADGSERRLTQAPGAERWPAIAPDGRTVAYVAERLGRTDLRLLDLATGSDEAVLRDRPVEMPAWSPAGDRIAFTSPGRVQGVWVMPRDGRYTNLVAERHAEPVWSPDGRQLALAGLPRPPPSYNGDPARLTERASRDVFPERGRLWLVDAPAVPGAGERSVAVQAIVGREAYNGRAFDRIWRRLLELYGTGPERADWRADWTELRARYRPRALAAEGEAELERVVHALVRDRPPLRREASGKAAVSSAHPLATAAGIEILRAGGNVVDAAVAVSFALGVVEPDASGIGGYGEMLIHLEGMDEPIVIEFLTRVPGAASLSNGALLEPDGTLPDHGPVLANVPGTVAGMWRAWQDYGSGAVAWADLVAPAIRLAEHGFPVSEGFGTTLALERERFLDYASSRALFFLDGEPLQAGDTLRNPDLAWTLRQIAEHGADAFYRGEVAQRMVRDLRGHGNAMTLADLARYYAAEREPVRTTYRGHTVYSGAPPVSGGALLAAKLNLFEQFDDPGPYTEDAATLHAMLEAWKLAPSTDGYIADPGLWPVSLAPFVSKDTARARWRCFDPARASTTGDRAEPPSPAVTGEEDCPPGSVASAAGTETTTPRTTRGENPDASRADGRGVGSERAGRASTGAGGARLRDRADADADADAGGCGAAHAAAWPGRCPSSGTTAFAVADADGNMVAVTQTLGTWGGNFYVTPGLGFLYNDKLRSYRTDPGAWGARLPHARNTTSIAPTLVFEGVGPSARPLLATGAAGNAWITAAVYEIVTGVIDQDLGPQRAIELPRFLVSNRRAAGGREPTVIQIEDGFAPDVIRELEAVGHDFQTISLKGELRMGYAAAIKIEDGRVRAGADPRRAGTAAAIP